MKLYADKVEEALRNGVPIFTDSGKEVAMTINGTIKVLSDNEGISVLPKGAEILPQQ